MGIRVSGMAARVLLTGKGSAHLEGSHFPYAIGGLQERLSRGFS